MSAAWPEIQSTERPGETIRGLLDYICWIVREMESIGFHSGTDRATWCRRVQKAYTALFQPMLPGHGDPYPPDVPPAKNPGIWPDVPAATIAGMTLRHQLTVIGLLANDLRSRVWPHIRAEEIRELDRRLSAARSHLDHGSDPEMPEEARSAPSQEALDEAAAQRKALRDRTRRRAVELRRQLKRAAAKKKATKKKAATEAVAKKVVAKKAAKKKAPKAKAAKKKAAKKKTAKKKAVKKKTVKKKTVKKKTAKKRKAR